jgi:hypothetical protein
VEERRRRPDPGERFRLVGEISHPTEERITVRIQPAAEIDDPLFGLDIPILEVLADDVPHDP